jgi:hypothetical protein
MSHVHPAQCGAEYLLRLAAHCRTVAYSEMFENEDEERQGQYEVMMFNSLPNLNSSRELFPVRSNFILRHVALSDL